MRLGCFRAVLALVLAAAWHGMSVNGETYVARCNQQPTQFTFTGSDEVTISCGETQVGTLSGGDFYSDAVEVSLENSIATVTVREGTTTTQLLFVGVNDTEVNVNIQNTDFSKATLMDQLMFENLKFVDPNVTLTVPDSLEFLRIGESNLDDVGLNVSDNCSLYDLQLHDTYKLIPRILYERNYTQTLNTANINRYTTFNWTGIQALNVTEIATLKHNVGNLSELGLILVSDCSSTSNNASTHLVCTSDTATNDASRDNYSPFGTAGPSVSSQPNTNSSGSRSISDWELSGGGSSTTTILIVIIIAAATVAAICATYLVIRYRRARKSGGAENTQTLIASVETPSNRRGKTIVQVQHIPDQLAHPRPWDDDVIVKARIPSDKVELDAVMSRGAFGEVYRGSYRGQQVAVKMLHPSMRHETNHIEIFFQEIKIMATLEHPNIVQFVGVAWDSLTEVCAVSELMDGGDLRTLLMEYHENREPQGFDSVKIKIAADVAHALTYLHSFQPVVLHRDLKSRNILLSADRKTAKVTDFGTSRERADITMTVGIGTSLWMAPEVIMGGRYDDKADIFSFGVVLSELATHELPYAQATKTTSGAPMSVAAIMQAVVSGHLHLDFAASAPHSSPEIVDLACACTRLDPSTRPAAATVAWRLIQILRNMTD